MRVAKRITAFSALLLVAAFAVFVPLSWAQADGYVSYTTWGSSGSGPGQFLRPNGVAADAFGSVYVVDTDNDRVQKFWYDGTFDTSWGSNGTGPGQFIAPSSVAVHESGFVYVSDTGNNRIQKFDSTGTFILEWDGSLGQAGEFDGPTGIAVDDSGNVYVVDSANYRIQKFDSGGVFLAAFGSYGTGTDEFLLPTGIAVDAFGFVYVTDASNDRVVEFTTGGSHVLTWGTSGSDEGQFLAPTGIAADPWGNVYVMDSLNHRLQKFSGTGRFITEGGSQGSGEDQYLLPSGIAVDNLGYVYTADKENNRILASYPTPFEDVAEDSWAKPYIDVIFQRGYTTGFGGSDEFRPDMEVTREQMAAFVVRALDGEPPSEYCSSGSPFVDVFPSDWSCGYIKRLRELGVTSGYGGSNQYRPELTVTRDQMAAFIIRAVDGEPPIDYCVSGSPFTDVSMSDWACVYIKRLYELQITGGYGGSDQYRPELSVTREQMAAFLARGFLEMP